MRAPGITNAWRALLLVLVGLNPAFAGDNYAVVITGASGGDAYAQKYDGWRSSLVSILREKFGYPEDHIFVLAEEESQGVRKATRENVKATFGGLRKRLTKEDLLFVLLIGHGTPAEGAGGDDAKFNLVGPDMTATEWAELVNPLAGRLVFVDTTAASFPFLRKLAGSNRIVLTATDSTAQQFETLFPEFFIKALDDSAADNDKNGRVSILEAFTYASAGVRQAFEQKGQLPTERPLLDDTGDGVGREAQNPGPDGAMARTTYVQPLTIPVVAGDTALTALLKQRADLEAQIEELKAHRASVTEERYQAELERLLLELARVSRQIRAKS